LDFNSAIANYGAVATAKLANPVAIGQPEDQLRAPIESLLGDLAGLCGLQRALTAVGEPSLSDLKTRPDFAVTVDKALVGHVELKAPGKGADPRKFRDGHDREQWDKLRSLPNLIYSDGNEFSLWQNGELARPIVRLQGDVESSGSELQAPPQLLDLFRLFLEWEPNPPRTPRELAKVSARLCRLLRDEVTEQLAEGSPPLTSLAVDWRKLLFPEATDATFADGYAQAVTFGLLMARAKEIPLEEGFHEVARDLGQTSTLIGAALRLLTDDVVGQQSLRTSLGTLTRVLSVVNWQAISKGDPAAWLYFYEDFLEVYDNRLRKLTGSYYTPPEVVAAMVRLVDEELQSPGFGQHLGIASPAVTLADPATGTGTFLLGILRRVAENVTADSGKGTVPPAINDAIERLVAFEMQLGPFAVAQLRLLAEIVELTGAPPASAPRLFVTDTLGDPEDEEGWIPGAYAQIASSRKDANKIKREEPITVVIGNPPYKEKARGKGAWVEGQSSSQTNRPAPLRDWIPPPDWGVGAHLKHLRNLYVYFWRWATWKVFDHGPGSKTGIVCFITMSGFLTGPGFQKMRDYLRRTCDNVWVIDCSPEGHQPEVATRIFQGVQQPVCIVLASRSPTKQGGDPARVRWRTLSPGSRDSKFDELSKIALGDSGWTDCPTEWRSPLVPASAGAWSTYPALKDLFHYHGSGVMPGRTWIIAPDRESLERRWKTLIQAPPSRKEVLFHPHLRGGQPGDKHVDKVVLTPLEGFPQRPKPVAQDSATDVPVQYAFRSFDRQWIIPDARLINQPNPELWATRSGAQIYLTAPSDRSPENGPAISFTSLIPDLHHYAGRGGRVFPLWSDATASVPNVRPAVVQFLSERLDLPVAATDLFAYIAALAAHPAFTSRFQDDLSTPGIRIPLTTDVGIFKKAVDIGRRVIWLHTFGGRMADASQGRSASPPRLPVGRRPTIPAEGAIPQDAMKMPDSIGYDSATKRLLLGSGYIENVEPAIWNYEVSGKQVLRQWFSYRKKDRDRPIIGDRRPPSPLGEIQPDHWLAEYTTELINVLNVLALLVTLGPEQAALLEAVCSGPLISVEELRAAGALETIPMTRRRRRTLGGLQLFDVAASGTTGNVAPASD
jgi:hypothetical protein